MSDIPRLDAYHFYEQEWESYEALCESFEWELPDRFNIADYVCDRWAEDKSRVAFFAEEADGTERTITFWEVRNASNQMANYLVDQGIEPGDRIGVMSPQKPETVMATLAIWKVGGVAIPLSTLFGPDAVNYRLGDAEAAAAFVDESVVDAFRRSNSDVGLTITIGDVEREEGEVDFWSSIADRSREFDTADTTPRDDAMLVYTSGTTGDPKGVRHGHEVMLGSLPQFITFGMDMDREASQVFYSPAAWAWVASTITLWAPLYYGIPVVSYNGQMEIENELRLLEKYGVTNYFNAPTGIRQLMQIEDIDEYELDLHMVYCGGEAVTQSIVDWVTDTFEDVAINQGYGLTEAMGVISDCEALMEFKEGTMGQESPGHDVTLVDPETSEPLDEYGTIGEIAVRYEGNPVCFKEYWNKPEKTAETKTDGLLLTGDLATVDEDGYYTFVGRKDDVIICSGYRIGPEEVEDTITKHDAVIDAGVIGVPDETRGEIPKAFVVVKDGHDPSDDLKSDLQQFVKDRLAKYEYPRDIEFIDELPTTVTGKVRRVDLRDREDVER